MRKSHIFRLSVTKKKSQILPFFNEITYLSKRNYAVKNMSHGESSYFDSYLQILLKKESFAKTTEENHLKFGGKKKK